MQKLFSRSFACYGVLILVSALAAVGGFELLNISVFSKFGSPHAVCYLADPKMIWLHVVSDSLIGAAYVSISLTLAYLVYKASRDIPFHGIFLAFGIFIVSCGFTHFMEVLVIWQPLYWLSGYVKTITAAASVATAIALFPLIPKVFAMINAVKEGEARRKQIEALNSELDAFTSSVAHDLRAPLRAISGMSQTLKEDYSDKLDENGCDSLERVIASAQRMDRLIIDLLNYSRIGNEAITFEKVNLDTIVAEAKEALAGDIRDSRAQITVASPLGVVHGSRTLILQALVNLIGNGLKFVPAGARPELRITSERLRGTIRIHVRDNGIGIAPDDQERIFKMFERLNGNYPGTGIGLAIVQKSIHRNGGTISVQSAPGEGSTFTIELPAN